MIIQFILKVFIQKLPNMASYFLCLTSSSGIPLYSKTRNALQQVSVKVTLYLSSQNFSDKNSGER